MAKASKTAQPKEAPKKTAPKTNRRSSYAMFPEGEEPTDEELEQFEQERKRQREESVNEQMDLLENIMFPRLKELMKDIFPVAGSAGNVDADARALFAAMLTPKTPESDFPDLARKAYAAADALVSVRNTREG